MGKILFILILLSFYGLVRSSSLSGGKETRRLQDTTLVRSIRCENRNTSMAVTDIGKCLIVEKDNSIIKNILIREIRPFWIVYEKDHSLHDILIEDISRIEINNSNLAIYFDDNRKPVIKTLNPKY